jgi:hypothetical protein
MLGSNQIEATAPRRNTLAWLAALAVLASAVACGGPGAYQAIPVEDARALNSRLSAFYSGTVDLLEASSDDVNVVGTLPAGIRPQDFNIQLVKNALMSCFDETIGIRQVTTEAPRGVSGQPGSDASLPLSSRSAMDNVDFCNPRGLIALESYLDYAPAPVRMFIVERMLMVDELRVNLKHVVQERLNLLEGYASDARVEVAGLRDTASERYEQVVTNEGEYTQAQVLQTEADYEVIQSELEDVERLVETIEGELPAMRSLRRQLVEDVSLHIAGMGTPGS